MPSIISPEQRGFIHGRLIRDCICLTSETINLLHNKSYGGNLALKIDISKAFDTINWDFLLKVLNSFGFSSKFCDWISAILKSAKLSISINGQLHGFFSCSRGVRQGDPLSPLLFCIAEDVLSRGISKLVESGNLELIKGTRHLNVPSHTLYADDIMIFCKGKLSNIDALMNLFDRYAASSGQNINPAKSTIFAGSINQARLHNIADKLGFSIGSTPFVYLGVPIFKGKPKARFLKPFVDKVKSKLAAWKASLLSIAGRVQLIKSVVHGMLLHSFLIYSWPLSLIKELELCMRNFIWSGDISKRKLVTVSWANVCQPISEGGLGIRSLFKLNEASNLKLCWDLFHSNEHWSNLLRSRVLRNQKIINYHIYSSIWSGLKGHYTEMMDNSSWLLGNGENINFWLDQWCGAPLVHSLDIPLNLHPLLSSTVNQFLVNNHWLIPPILVNHYPQLLTLINQVSIPLELKSDELVWNNSASGSLSLKDAYLHQAPVGQNLGWTKLLWNHFIPPAKSLLVWRLMYKKLPTDDNLMVRGCHLPSMCSICLSCAESSNHLFFQCHFATLLWNWFLNLLNIHSNIAGTDDIWKLCDRGWGPQCKTVISAAVINIINVIWYCRNQSRVNNVKPLFNSARSLIIANVSISGNNTTATATASMRDFSILKFFNVKLHPPNAPVIKEVLWLPPFVSWIKCNTDGAATGSPGQASCAGVFRDHNAQFLGAFNVNLGISYAFHAELLGVMNAIEIAHEKGWWNLWLETDSMMVTLAYKSSAMVPWLIRNRWNNCMYKLKDMNFFLSHIYREGNVLADKLASLGLVSPGLMLFLWRFCRLIIIID
jgi:ribonuclease HI